MNALLLAPAFLAAACMRGDRGSGAESPEPPLRYRLEARARYTAGEPVMIEFTLENRSGDTLRVLKWYTPLEGLNGRILEVTREGKPLPYLGRMVKRGPPAAGDYLSLGRGASASATFDLARAYDLSVPGRYRVAFAGRILDVARQGEAVPRPGREQGMAVPGNAVELQVLPRR